MDKAELLRKFLANQCTLEELKQLMVDLRDDAPLAYEDVFNQVWDTSEGEGHHHSSVPQRVRTEVRRKLAVRARMRRRRIWRFSAAAVVGVVLSTALFNEWRGRNAVHYATNYGETTQIMLPDSSTVTLNGNSSLSYRASWDDNPSEAREVHLRGEGFFSVRKQTTRLASARSFVVHTDQLSVAVLGTTFNVNDRGQEASVVLSTGRVQLNTHQHPQEVINLSPGQRAWVPAEGQALGVQTVDPQMYTAWKDGRLMFHRTPIHQIAKMLQTTYGLEVSITPPTIATRIFTGKIPSCEVEVLLQILAESMQLTITREGSHVRIGPPRTHS